MTETLTVLEGEHVPDLAPGGVHSSTVAFWAGTAILTVAALAVAPLLRRSVAEIATDGAPACVELKGAS